MLPARIPALLALLAAAILAIGSAAPSQTEASPESPSPQRDYVAILDRFDAIVAQMLFDPRILDTNAWQRFREDFGEMARNSSDDSELIAAFDEALEAANLFSHFKLRSQTEAVEEVHDAADHSGSQDPVAEFERRGEAGIIRIRRFFGEEVTEQIGAQFDTAIVSGVSSLVIDLRGNPGGTFAAWPAISRLAPHRIPVGYLLAGRWFADHQNPPSAIEVASATPVTEPNRAALAADLMDDGLLVMAVDPEPPIFDGHVFVLVDEQTASTSEIVGAALQQNGIVQIVGPGSAGEVLNAEQVELAEGLFLHVPLADFFLPDGRRLEGSGIEPDHRTTSDGALECALALARGAEQC